MAHQDDCASFRVLTGRAARARAGRHSPTASTGDALANGYLSAFLRQTFERFRCSRQSPLRDGARRGYRSGPNHFRHLVAFIGASDAKPTSTRRLLASKADRLGFLRPSADQSRQRPLIALLRYSMVTPDLSSLLSDVVWRVFCAATSRRSRIGAASARTSHDDLAARYSSAAVMRFDFIHTARRRRAPPLRAKAVAVARGNEKGRVERAIRYVRENFFARRRTATSTTSISRRDVVSRSLTIGSVRRRGATRRRIVSPRTSAPDRVAGESSSVPMRSSRGSSTKPHTYVLISTTLRAARRRSARAAVVDAATCSRSRRRHVPRRSSAQL